MAAQGFGGTWTGVDGMKIMRRIACLFGRHHRDSHGVWHDGETFRSVCAGCRAPMMRDFHGWHLVGAPGRGEQPAGK